MVGNGASSPRGDHLVRKVRPEGVLVILLGVQEEPPVASFIKRGLEAEGFVVRIACDGAEGLEMSRSGDLDLIVLDLILPTVTGEEILATLRAAGSSVPVIVLTASDAVR